MKPANAKRINQRRHARQRAQERFGVSLNREQMQDIIDQVRGNRATFIARQSNRVSLWAIQLPDNSTVIAAYDKHRHVIITFLPQEDRRYALLSAAETTGDKP